MSQQPRFLKLLRLISLLSSGRKYTVKKLAAFLEVTSRSVYRAFDTLEEAGFLLDKDFEDQYFLHENLESRLHPKFSPEELEYIRQWAGALKEHPTMNSILLKLFQDSELPAVKEILMKARLQQLAEKCKHALEDNNQVLIKNYHSAESGEIKDRLLEIIEIKPDYRSLLGFEIESKQSKIFKLERMADVIILKTKTQHHSHYQKPLVDLFGMSGDHERWIELHLSMRAYHLMREEFPATVDYLHHENDNYFFHGPIRANEGIGRFILGLPGEIKKVKDDKLLNYMKEKRAVEKWV
ncbi:helix-turn-helix transcriptional regulator [Marivirga sp.]|uniref:helix-turn-helix transcriptional regulator n=1 Tax=Marivirga sp. TaxID=2018662 RepID=UPI002D7E5E70|nr:WYL domain-containing protein [Marivirga sp.]HET8861459.1 WYL domain-containing protein [Marivirga sp.]